MPMNRLEIAPEEDGMYSTDMHGSKIATVQSAFINKCRLLSLEVPHLGTNILN